MANLSDITGDRVNCNMLNSFNCLIHAIKDNRQTDVEKYRNDVVAIMMKQQKWSRIYADAILKGMVENFLFN